MREDWIEVELGKLCEYSKGKKPKLLNKGYSDAAPFPYINIKAFEKGIFEEYTDGVKCNLCEEGDLLMVWDGARAGFTGKAKKGAIGSTLMKIEPKAGVEKNYLFYFLLSIYKKLNANPRGVGIPHVEPRLLWDSHLILTPLPIQRAIVSKIETLFSDLDKGIDDLKKAQAQLKIYRQAVLKKAFEGELTKGWREQQTNLPTADKLLAQIKQERQKHYEQQLENWKQAVKKWEENGKDWKKPTKPKVWKQVEDFTEIELSKLSILPDGWRWVKLGNIFQIFVGSTPSRKENNYWVDGAIRWVSSGEVAFNSISDTKEKITEDGLANSSTTVHPIGTVMLAMIGEGKTRGQSAILAVEACHNQNTAAIRVSEMGFGPKFLFHYLFLKYERNRRVGSGNNQKALNQGRIMEFDYPLCSKQEQHQIVREIESRLSVCDKVEKDIALAIEGSQNLRQSILKKAFEGRLLSEAEVNACKQEPDYEPAAVLLSRIENS